MADAVPQTHTYKTMSGCDTRLDVYSGPQVASPAPCVVWIHGGNLTGGSRRGVHPMVLGLGYTVVAIDYRLAPESKLPEIIADVSDALAWVRDKGPALYDIDCERLGVIGHSAGGYLALMSGTFPTPPRALVTFYGYGDIAGDWATTPGARSSDIPAMSGSEAEEARRRPPVSDISERTYDIRPFDRYCVENGHWPYAITGRHPRAEPGFFSTYCPIQNITSAYPPTMLLHGDCDDGVPLEQSAMMAEELARNGVPAELVTITGGTHSFDRIGPPAQARHAYERVSAFLDEHLGRAGGRRCGGDRRGVRETVGLDQSRL